MVAYINTCTCIYLKPHIHDYIYIYIYIYPLRIFIFFNKGVFFIRGQDYRDHPWYWRCFVLSVVAARQSRKGLPRVLPCYFIGLALAAFTVSCSTVSRRLPWRGPCGSDESLQADETVVGATPWCCLGCCSVFIGRAAGA